MKNNMGSTDRAIRLMVALLLVTLFVTNVVTGIVGIVLTVAGIILFVTSIIGFCPIYGLFGITSCPLNKA